MSTNQTSFYFRRRTIGRAASPPTWACYEQIPYDDEDDYSESGSESCSEDDEDYAHSQDNQRHDDSDSEESDNERPDDKKDNPRDGNNEDGQDDIDMDIDDEAVKEKTAQNTKDVKGKQRAVDPEPTPKRHRRKRRQPLYTLRPILTIQRSQGFVWNQDLFVPPYIKDRYIASTSPPHHKGYISTSASSTNSALGDYEVEVVEIRVKEGELRDIIP
ncbi:hypothetical protein AX16_007519 [Volvariella volvacea WC 439]|nr:hypothetical protein AX16_007519 [Volvariella volvacea WC 439]